MCNTVNQHTSTHLCLSSPWASSAIFLAPSISPAACTEFARTATSRASAARFLASCHPSAESRDFPVFLALFRLRSMYAVRSLRYWRRKSQYKVSQNSLAERTSSWMPHFASPRPQLLRRFRAFHRGVFPCGVREVRTACQGLE